MKGADAGMRFGTHVRPCKLGGSKILARSRERPTIQGITESKGVKLDLIRKADVRIAIVPMASSFMKWVGIQLKAVTVVPTNF